MIFFAVVFRKFCKKSRSSHQRCSKENIIVKKAVLNKFCNIYRKTPVPESLFDKVVGLQACSFVKKRLQHRCFSVNMKFLRTLILKYTCE